ncbi:NAD-dependent epimerase/dehydratase family protein [Oxalobacteraceae bacterium OTU3REALA1]|nr:NAD-dependent epimerase/dehydratase family protein [Oxalobacteraceae bacterium OTU3REALA1]
MDINSMISEKIVVTGAGGFIGGALVHRLGSIGVEVCGLVRDEAALQKLQYMCRNYRQVEVRICDVRSPTALRQCLVGAHTVYHAAALVNSNVSEKLYYETNVEGTRNVCSASIEAQVSRLVYLSTSDVFGLPESTDNVTEKWRFAKWGEKYPDTKILATEMVQQFRAIGLQSAIVYPGWVYGPGDQQFLPSLATQLRSGVIPTWKRPTVKLNLIHIEDLLDGLILVGSRPEALGQDFILLNSASVPLTEICDAIGAFFGLRHRAINMPYATAMYLARAAELFAKTGLTRQPLITTAIVKSFGFQFNFDTSKAFAQLGWKPKMEFAEGIQSALEWQQDRLNVH